MPGILEHPCQPLPIQLAPSESHQKSVQIHLEVPKVAAGRDGTAPEAPKDEERKVFAFVFDAVSADGHGRIDTELERQLSCGK